MKDTIQKFHLDISPEQMTDLEVHGSILLTTEDTKTNEVFEFYITTNELAGEMVDSILGGDLDAYVERLTKKAKNERR